MRKSLKLLWRNRKEAGLERRLLEIIMVGLLREMAAEGESLMPGKIPAVICATPPSRADIEQGFL